MGGLGLFSQLSSGAWLSFGSFSQLSQGVIREIVETARLVDDMLVEISGILKPEARPPQIVKRHVPRSSNTRPRSSNGRLMQLESQPTGIDRNTWRFVTITGARHIRQSGWWRSDATEKQGGNWYDLLLRVKKQLRKSSMSWWLLKGGDCQGQEKSGSLPKLPWDRCVLCFFQFIDKRDHPRTLWSS